MKVVAQMVVVAMLSLVVLGAAAADNGVTVGTVDTSQGPVTFILATSNRGDDEAKMGRMMLRRDRFEPAIAHLKKAIELDANGQTAAYSDLAETYRRSNADFQTTRDAYLKAFEKHAEATAMCHCNYAILLSMSDLREYADEASEHFRKAIEMNPDYTLAKQEFAAHLEAFGMNLDTVAKDDTNKEDATDNNGADANNGDAADNNGADCNGADATDCNGVDSHNGDATDNNGADTNNGADANGDVADSHNKDAVDCNGADAHKGDATTDYSLLYYLAFALFFVLCAFFLR